MFENILQSHQEATRRRIASQPLVIAAQDTTEIDFTRPEAHYWDGGPVITAIFAPANAVDRLLRPDRWSANPPVPTPLPPNVSPTPIPVSN
jgi:hypothetical protein